MTMRLGVVMDAITRINYKKDSTLAMLLEAKQRGFVIYYFEQKDLYIENGVAFGKGKKLQVFANENKWFEFEGDAQLALAELDIILMRKDPPFDANYIYTTYILELAEKNGALVVNKPQSLRDANEKIFATYFPQFCPPHLVSQSTELLLNFWQQYRDIVVKPLDGMGGVSIYRLAPHDVNANVIIDSLTHGGSRPIMAQQFLPAINTGDKRIILINGEAVDHSLARIPQGKDWRGNLAAGAKGVVQPLTPRDREICDAISPVLREMGLYFVGIDVIGDYLTEINVTSPTGIREIEHALQINIAGMLFDSILK